ncbi:hypothetical protein OHA33_25550 [Streptomyces sp. NBC_00562]|uniref:DUF7848 domain-containing protein n=1 Tax=Streptomyces sp. NBC_00562 TaxID=2975777 RepID=UPI002E7FF6A1|nr:hypothetical protein [Streptomyces sp. NBC_00562]WUC21963.1 hypothetical protein OHA33_25550 [Streptomyces sp. NBC_00562]
MTRAVLRYVEHRITQYPNTDVTFEAECLRCEWQATPSPDGAAVDVECMCHTGRCGHEGFRRICTSFAMVVRAGADGRGGAMSSADNGIDVDVDDRPVGNAGQPERAETGS